MFNLRRYFSLTSAAVIIVVTVVIAISYRHYAINELVEIAERQNVTLARSFANFLWPRFSSYVMSASERDRDTLRARPETPEIHEVLEKLTAEIPVLKVKIYNLDGITVYSSEPSQIGADKSENPGFLSAALEGTPASKLSYHDTFGAFLNIVHDRNFVETYVPVRSAEGRIEGVFELYIDVTPLVVRIEDGTTELVAVLLLSFGLMYGSLFLIVRRADLILKKQYMELENEVAERTRAEEALRESEERFRAVVNNSPTKIHIKDADGRYILVNSEAEKLFGVTDAEARGKTTQQIFPKEQANAFIGHDQAVLESGQPIEQEEEWLREDGIHTFFTVKFPILDAAGNIAAVGAIGTDITERKRMEEALRASEARLAGMLDFAPEAVISVDEGQCIQLFNQGAEAIFGYSVDEVLGQSFDMLLPSRFREEHHKSVEAFASAPEISVLMSARAELIGLRKNRTEFPAEASISKLDLGGNRVFTIMLRDITARKKAEAERVELERELGQAQKLESLGTLAGGIAHEINTPVQFVWDNTRFLKTAFLGLSVVLQKHMALREAAAAGGVLTDAVAEASAAAEAKDTSYLLEEIPGAIEHSLEGLDQIAEIVQAIKAFSYPDMKEKIPTDINDCITTTITVSRNQWKYSAELETDFDASLPPVPCLPGEFNQVILNLIVNAAHAIEDSDSGSKGRITISTRRVKDWAEVRISDTGTGIPEENYDKLFEPFFTTKEPGRGTGQGLAISHTIITKKHGGTLKFISEIGKGTEFVIRLPLADHRQSKAAA